MIPPDDCQTMTEVRAGVDALDAQIVELLATRFAFMRAAARIKPNREAVRDEQRKARVVGNAKAEAARLGVPLDVVDEVWERLVEASIAYELARWDEQRGSQ